MLFFVRDLAVNHIINHLVTKYCTWVNTNVKPYTKCDCHLDVMKFHNQILITVTSTSASSCFQTVRGATLRSQRQASTKNTTTWINSIPWASSACVCAPKIDTTQHCPYHHCGKPMCNAALSTKWSAWDDPSKQLQHNTHQVREHLTSRGQKIAKNKQQGLKLVRNFRQYPQKMVWNGQKMVWNGQDCIGSTGLL